MVTVFVAVAPSFTDTLISYVTEPRFGTTSASSNVTVPFTGTVTV